MDGWPAGLFVYICTISSVRRQFHVQWNHLVCPSTVPGGTVTEIIMTDKRCKYPRGTKRDRRVLWLESACPTDGDRNKG